MYPKCEGGYDVCCDTMECGAQNENCRLRFQRDIARRGITSVWREAAAFMTLAQARQPTQLPVKSVRQCAQRGAVDLDVAQASPLFSDHAPREVHLWQ